MKKMIALLLAVGAALGVNAQSTQIIKGAVVDKYGNPLSGAKVEAKGGAESAVTDADGSYSIEVSRYLQSLIATYPGMKKKTIDLDKVNKNDALFRMKKDQHKNWFINLVTMKEVNLRKYGDFWGLGIMAGRLDNWGWYGKFITDIDVDRIDKFKPTISVGFTKDLGLSSFPLHFYFGIGYASVYEYEREYYTSPYYSYYYKYPVKTDGALLEAGFLTTLSHFSINVGYTYRHTLKDFFETDEAHGGIHLGIGYAF